MLTMKRISAFFKIIDIQTFVVALLAIGSTYLCNRFEFFADLPSSLIGIAIIFPIVFSINTAYKRREEALKYFASLKAHAVAIYYAHKDWVPEDRSHITRARELKCSLLNAVRDYFASSAETLAIDLARSTTSSIDSDRRVELVKPIFLPVMNLSPTPTSSFTSAIFGMLSSM